VVKHSFYFGLEDPLHLSKRHRSDHAILGGASQRNCFILFGYVIESLDMADLQIGNNDCPMWSQKAELAETFSCSIFQSDYFEGNEYAPRLPLLDIVRHVLMQKLN
jgi:hypothetical protein